MRVNKYVFKNILLFGFILLVFGWLITFINYIQQEMQIREGYRVSMRGTRNIVRDIYKYGYFYTSKMLRM